MMKTLKNQVVSFKQPDRIFENRIWVRTEAAAEILERSVGQIRNMVWRGQLKAKKFKGRLYFDKDYLLASLESAPFV